MKITLVRSLLNDHFSKMVAYMPESTASEEHEPTLLRQGGHSFGEGNSRTL